MATRHVDCVHQRTGANHSCKSSLLGRSWQALALGALAALIQFSPTGLPGDETPAAKPADVEQASAPSAALPTPRIYQNTLVPIRDPQPLLADFPQYVQPIEDKERLEAPPLVMDEGADLTVRAWRYSYNARAIIEIPNRLRGDKTAIVVVHPWGIDDGQGWKSPEPAGAAFGGTPEKNQLMLRHGRDVINPFLQQWRSRVGLVLYSLPGKADPIRSKLYRSTTSRPSEQDRVEAQQELQAKLASFDYSGEPVPSTIALTKSAAAVDYFRQFPGIEANARTNGEGYWDLPIPVMRPIEVAADDVVLYDTQGYPALREFLQANGIVHVLLCGYHADMCVCKTTAGYENLSQDFDVFLVGDAVQSTLPANPDSRYATNQAVSYAALNLLITQVSWVALR